MDENTFLESVRRTGRAVIVHEAPRTCGLGAEITARINEKALLSLQAPVERITGYDTIVPLMKLENLYLAKSRKDPEGHKESHGFLRGVSWRWRSSFRIWAKG